MWIINFSAVIQFQRLTLSLEKQSKKFTTICSTIDKKIKSVCIFFRQRIIYELYMERLLENCFYGWCTHAMYGSCHECCDQEFSWPPFEEIADWASTFSNNFASSGKRKNRYLTLLKSLSVNPTMPRKPIATRWTSKFRAAEYHEEYLQYNFSFL